VERFCAGVVVVVVVVAVAAVKEELAKGQ